MQARVIEIAGRDARFLDGQEPLRDIERRALGAS
jgi:hypothetical protein